MLAENGIMGVWLSYYGAVLTGPDWARHARHGGDVPSTYRCRLTVCCPSRVYPIDWRYPAGWPVRYRALVCTELRRS